MTSSSVRKIQQPPSLEHHQDMLRRSEGSVNGFSVGSESHVAGSEQPGRPPARGTEEGMEADDLLCSRNARSGTPLTRVTGTSWRASGWAGEKVARSGRSISPHTREITSELGGSRSRGQTRWSPVLAQRARARLSGRSFWSV
jgi:hypothetical protein